MNKVYAVIKTASNAVVAVCELEIKAIAFAKAGANRVVREFEVIEQPNAEGKITRYVPFKLVNIIPANPEDQAEQNILDNQRSALAKAKAAGMSRAEILALIAIDQEEVK